jgi:hypothetical protein
VHVPLGQRRGEPPVEEFPGLIQAEPQVLGPYLGELAAHPQPAHRQRRVGPGNDDQVQLRWAAVQQGADRFMHLALLTM